MQRTSDREDTIEDHMRAFSPNSQLNSKMFIFYYPIYALPRDHRLTLSLSLSRCAHSMSTERKLCCVLFFFDFSFVVVVLRSFFHQFFCSVVFLFILSTCFFLLSDGFRIEDVCIKFCVSPRSVCVCVLLMLSK